MGGLTESLRSPHIMVDWAYTEFKSINLSINQSIKLVTRKLSPALLTA